MKQLRVLKFILEFLKAVSEIVEKNITVEMLLLFFQLNVLIFLIILLIFVNTVD